MPAPAVTPAADAAPAAGVAAQAGKDLSALLAWVGSISEAWVVPDIFTDEEKLQRGICALLSSLLSAPPPDATLGHPELEALRPLLALGWGDRELPELAPETAQAPAAAADVAPTGSPPQAVMGAA